MFVSARTLYKQKKTAKSIRSKAIDKIYSFLRNRFYAKHRKNKMYSIMTWNENELKQTNKKKQQTIKQNIEGNKYV